MYETEQDREYPRNMVPLCTFVDETISGISSKGKMHSMHIKKGKIALVGGGVYFGVIKPEDERYIGNSFKVEMDLKADDEAKKQQLMSFLYRLLVYDSGMEIEPSSVWLHNEDLATNVLLQMQANAPKPSDN